MCRCWLLLIFSLAVGPPIAQATDRVPVAIPPAGQDAAETLVGSLEAACNRGDFIGFIDHFTPSHGRRIRRSMENIFITHEPRMDIRKVMLLSESEDTITFGVRYAWHPSGKPEEVIASRVTARKIDGKWKLDGEKIKAVSHTDSESDYGPDAGRVGFNPFNPPADLIEPGLEHLRGDVGIRPGRGCADGRCGR